jgi:Mg2+ and Co2+ transporter CorA
MANNDSPEDGDHPMSPEITRFPSIVETATDRPQGLRLDTGLAPPLADVQQSSQSDSGVVRGDINTSPTFLRRRKYSTPHRDRAPTFRTVEDFEEFEGSYSAIPGWEPGAEPGYNPELPDGGHANIPNRPCAITVVDFSRGQVEKRHFENESFIEYLDQPKPKWAKCRWININGLSWDVIQAVGSKKDLHKLALEDVMTMKNRVKADWYSNHAYIVLTLQKLVTLVEDDDDDSSDSSSSVHSRRSFAMLRDSFMDFWKSRKEAQELDKELHAGQDPEKELTNDSVLPQRSRFAGGSFLPETSMLRTLQRYHSSSNEARIEFMERHSSLTPYKMAISAEQVSIFLTADNTVISFFEVSAGDIERPIVRRLSTPGTILRESYDASLLVQAIIDAIVDLAIPLTAVYSDIIGDIELDVLTSPSINQSKRLYICISEINKMLSSLNPIDNLMNVLRDHKTDLSQEEALKTLDNPESGVIITPMTHTYLGDVLDHCITITENLQQLKRASDNLIDLIFNTISSGQNESMKQLTIVTIIFLPLTFITGFFGMNFPEAKFPEVNNGIWYL